MAQGPGEGGALSGVGVHSIRLHPHATGVHQRQRTSSLDA
jgi:hypothetical protein